MWYVIKSKPKQESNLYKLISHHHIFYPQYKKTTHSLAPYFNQYLFINSNNILRDVNDLKYTKGLDSFLKVNGPYQAIRHNFMVNLQSFFENDGAIVCF